MENHETDSNVQLAKRLSQVRLLSHSDHSQIEELINPRLTYLESKGVNVSAFTSKLDLFLDREHNPSRHLFGYFDESDRLNSMMGVYLWSFMPFGTLSYMFVKKNSKLFSADRHGLNLCLHKCIEVSEAKGVTTFFSLQNAKSYKHKSRTWRYNETCITKKYFSLAQAEIRAGTKSNFTGIQDLMDHQTWPYDLTLWMTLLKPEYQRKIS